MIQSFEQLRSDGTELPEGITAAQVLAPPGKQVSIIQARWISDAGSTSVSAETGLSASVVAGRHFVASIENVPEPAGSNVLRLYAADGSLHGQLPNEIEVPTGLKCAGTWGWFLPADGLPVDCFRVTFTGTWRDGDGKISHQVDYPVDISAVLGAIITVHRGQK